jgi:hypothetical protein
MVAFPPPEQRGQSLGRGCCGKLVWHVVNSPRGNRSEELRRMTSGGIALAAVVPLAASWSSISSAVNDRIGIGPKS